MDKGGTPLLRCTKDYLGQPWCSLPLMPPGIPLPLLPLPLGAGAPRGHRTPALNSVQLRGGKFLLGKCEGQRPTNFLPRKSEGLYALWAQRRTPLGGWPLANLRGRGGVPLQQRPQQGHLIPWHDRLPKGLQIPRGLGFENGYHSPWSPEPAWVSEGDVRRPLNPINPVRLRGPCRSKRQAGGSTSGGALG